MIGQMDLDRIIYIVLPIFLILGNCWFFVYKIQKKTKVFPLFNLGVICLFTTAIYSAFPLINYVAGNFEWTRNSDLRLFIYDPTPKELGQIAYRSITYIVSFSLCYLGFSKFGINQLKYPKNYRTYLYPILFPLLIFSVYFIVLDIFFNVSYNPSYSDRLRGLRLPDNLPVFVQQISHNLFNIVVLLKQALLLVLIKDWQKKKIRWIIITWLICEVLITILTLGKRTELVLLLLTFILLFHKFVKPFTIKKLLLIGSLGLVLFLTYGVIRDVPGGIQEFSTNSLSYFSMNNEMQAVFATNFDMLRRKNDGMLNDIPFQIYIYDLISIIPSQLLPFKEYDPSDWYIEIIGLSGKGLGYMFGVISQAIIGFDWIELIIRGSVLGGLFAFIHNFYEKHVTSFWVTFFYLCMCVWSYYTYRGTTFYFNYYIVYRFIPVILIVSLLKQAFQKGN